METKNIVVCGVGGQGTILATDILSYVLFLNGYDVKKSEIHGMSQREGAVISFIKYGDKVFSPVVAPYEADFLVSFEKLEALRNINYINPNSIVIINDLQIDPLPVKLGLKKYPENIVETFKSITDKTILIDSLSIAKELGNVKIINIIILGFLSNYFSDINEEYWYEAIRKYIKAELIDINIKAFKKGKEL